MRREPPMAKVLPRQPGTKESRYMHLLCGDALNETLFKKAEAFWFRAQWTDDMRANAACLDTGHGVVHFPYYDHAFIEAANRIPYAVGARPILVRHGESLLPFTDKPVLRALARADLPHALRFRGKATRPWVDVCFNSPFGAMARGILLELGTPMIARLDPELGRAVTTLADEFLAVPSFGPQHERLLWRVSNLMFAAVLDAVCREPALDLETLQQRHAGA